ncbi:MATE family efflux transporter [Acidaminobacter sp. JC074]|uniref:MATE family efflux transporter n=1 Tax=Acidaminobacter sp. JC074 TaxID=2530199 RepID=UPI001F101B24|nr:MATE family efflux transporter [Acidaminobacter sp. JC074]
MFFYIFGNGAVALVARKYGEKDMEAVNNYDLSSVLLSLILGTIMGVFAFVFRYNSKEHHSVYG